MNSGPLRQTLKDALRPYPELLAVARASVYAVRDLYGGTVGRLLAARSRDYLKDAEEPKLHLGCADIILPGWLNTDAYPRRLDVAYCNATRRFPFPDNSFAYVFTEHMIGHVLPRGGENLIRESFRILRPGGRIRIATPDLNRIIALKEPNLTDTEREYLAWQTAQIPSAIAGSPCFTINTFFRELTTFIYDFDTLRQILRRNGYTDVQAYSPGESDSPAMCGLERHDKKFPNPAFNLIETIVVEAAKPSA